MIKTEDTLAAVEAGDLLARARRGEGEAFCQLAARQEVRLYRQALALCGHAQTAEDLTAETMVEAWRSLGRYDGTCRFSTWLYAILWHRYQKYVRKSRSRLPSFAFVTAQMAAGQAVDWERTPDPQPLAPDYLMAQEQAKRLETSVRTLRESQQAVVFMRFYEEASLSEIAAALGVPLGTVKSRLHQALARLRQTKDLVNLYGDGGDKQL